VLRLHSRMPAPDRDEMPIGIPLQQKIMLKTFAVALLATTMFVGLAEAKGAKATPKPPPPCDMEQQTNATCLCGPGKMLCPKGMFCHTFLSTCTR
jgi:hypothetical protein